MISESYQFYDFVQTVQDKNREEIIRLIKAEEDEGNNRTLHIIDGKVRKTLNHYILRLGRLNSLLNPDDTGIVKNYLDKPDLILCRPLLENLLKKREYPLELFNQLHF